jgi:twitching motility protein PilT
MPLRFISKLQKAIPENYLDVDVCQMIAMWLDENPGLAQECRETLKTWLLLARHKSASDIDFGALGCGGKVWLRIYGSKKVVEDIDDYNFIETSAIILSWLTPTQIKDLFQRRSVDFSLSIVHEEQQHRYRGSCYFDCGHLAANFRVIDSRILTMENLGIPQAVAQRLNLRYEKAGLVLITGITGSGKSTTLDAIIDMNNRDNAAHIVIIGHPIEHVHTSKKSLVRHREVGPDVLSFEAGAVEALRQDPDIIVVGEMRDAQTIATVLEITDGGHKALSTLHTSSAIDSIHRIVAEFPPEEQDRIRNRLADVLSVCISQKLVPTVDGKLVLAKEILSVDHSVQSALRNKNIGEIYQMMVEGKRYGMFTLEQDLRELQRKGIITQQSAMNYANNKKRMQQLLTMA